MSGRWTRSCGPFAKAILRCWLEGNRDNGREIFICPELGPVEGGYALSAFRNSWEEAKILRYEIDRPWVEAIAELRVDQAVVTRL